MRVNRLSPARVRQRSAVRTPTPHAPRLRPGSASAPPPPAPLSSGERAKAAADAVLAALMLVPALPLIAVCVVLVRLTSRGPAIYTQSRVGRGGVVFTLYKIRTMYHDCEKLTGPT